MTDFYVDRNNILQNKYREEWVYNKFFMILNRYLDRHRKRLEEISKRKTKNMASLETDISMRINNNKK